MDIRPPTTGSLFHALLLLTLALVAARSGAQDADDGDGEPQTTPAPTIRTHVYDRMIEAQTCLDDNDLDCALETLDRIAGMRGLTQYEQANLLNFYAAAHISVEDFEAASEAYEQLLELPAHELPGGLIQSVMKNLSSMYWSLGRLRDALDLFDQWIALPATIPGSHDYYLKGTLHYQLEEFPEGAAAVELAIELANNQGELGEENWYQLLAALYSELGKTDLVIETLTVLVENWTKREHVMRLAGQLNQIGRDTETLSLFEAAYDIGWLTSNRDLVSLAAMHIQAGAPYKAALVLERGLDEGTVDSTDRNWIMLAESWQRARQHDQAIVAYEKASALAEDGHVDLRLAQAYAVRYRWEDCVAAARQALSRGELSSPDDAYMELGRCLANLRRYDEAEKALERAAAWDDSRVLARQWLQYVFVLRSTEQDNEDKLRQANEIARGEPDFR